MTTNNPLRTALTPLLDALIPVGHYPGEPARLAGRIPAGHLAYLPDTDSTRLALAVMVDAHAASLLADTAPPADELVRDLRRLLEDCTPVLATIGAVDTVRGAVRRLLDSDAPQTNDQLEGGLQQTNPETDWALVQLRKYPSATNERIVALIVALRRMAYARLLENAATVRWVDPVPTDPVAEYVAANTPPDLARRPGDLLKEAMLFAIGSAPDAEPVAWAYAADHFQKLLAQGAQPEPTDLPMDGTDPADRQLLETAVRALEDFGQDRPLATGGYRQDRLDRMAGAIRTATWLRACMNGSAKLTDMAPPGPDEVRVTITLGDGPLRFTDPDLRSDSGEFPCAPAAAPVPPMVGRWDMAEWDADNRVGEQPFGLQPDDMVVVAAEPDGPYQLDRAGAFYWGPNALAGKTIRWWRRASTQEVELGKPLQQTRTTTFPMSDTPAEPERRYGSPTWADFDRLQGQVLAMERRLKAHDDAMVF